LNDEVAAALLGVLVVVMATPIQGIWVAARGKVPESLEAAGQIAAIAWAGLGARAASMGIYLAVVGLAFLFLMVYRFWRTRNDTREVLNPTVEYVGPWPWPSELGGPPGRWPWLIWHRALALNYRRHGRRPTTRPHISEGHRARQDRPSLVKPVYRAIIGSASRI
jgi:hypothetical protein